MADFRYVGKDEVRVYRTVEGNQRAFDLLWGDRVEIIDETGARTKIRARGRRREGYVDPDALNGRALLELYFIDVGQGDGILIVTPDRRHIMVDGGYPRAKQNTGKSAADFVDWKFFHDYKEDTIRLDAMICSHNDEDHYGGLADLLDVSQTAELDCEEVTVDRFYHAGLSWWQTPSNARTLGRTTISGGRTYYTDLLTDRRSAEDGLRQEANPRLQGMWANFIQKVAETRDRSGAPVAFERLSTKTEHLPGFDQGEVSIAVLGPVEHQTSHGPGLRKLAASSSQNTNGHSILMRIDYGHARILLTGDLNKNSQRVLLEAYEGKETEFLADVAKACHHGSDDVSFEFLAAMKAAVTVICSGDAEGHDHPRPSIVGASGTTGYLTVKSDEILTPLVYSTELARSLSLGVPNKLEIPTSGQGKLTVSGNDFENTRIHYTATKPGALRPEKGSAMLGRSYIVAGLVYGLVNVRTDGQRILCATMNEGDATWQIKSLTARF